MGGVFGRAPAGGRVSGREPRIAGPAAGEARERRTRAAIVLCIGVGIAIQASKDMAPDESDREA